MAATLAERGERIAVAVAGTDLPAGAEVSAGRIRWVEVPASSALARSLVGTAKLRSERWVAARALANGEPLRPSDLVPARQWQSRRTMGLAVGRAAAAGGTLVVGDRVDVSTAGGRARFVAGGLEVVGLPGGGERGFLAEPGREATVVVAVEPEEALALAQAVAAGPIQLIRATGARTVPVEPAGTVPGGGGTVGR